MISTLVKERLNELFSEMAEAERKTEICRQVLQEIDFNPYAGFKCMITDPPSGITVQEFNQFFNKHGVFPSFEELSLLFAYLDVDRDGLISWCEFLNRILSKEMRGKRFDKEAAYENFGDSECIGISPEAEHALLRVFEQEMKNVINLENIKRLVSEDPYFDELLVFDMLDNGKKNYIMINDILAFIKSHNENTHVMKAEKIFRRFDEDHDDRVYFEEFVFGIRPMLCYKYDNPGPQRKPLAPAVFYHLEAIEPLRKSYSRKKSKISYTEFKHRENSRHFRCTSPTRVSPVRENGYNSMGKVNPSALFPTNNQDKAWYNKNPINFRGYYDWELLKKSYGLTNERSKQVEHMLIRTELEASKYMSPTMAKRIENKLQNSTEFIKTAYSPNEFNKLRVSHDKLSRTTSAMTNKKATKDALLKTQSNKKRDTLVHEKTADTKIAKGSQQKKLT